MKKVCSILLFLIIALGLLPQVTISANYNLVGTWIDGIGDSNQPSYNNNTFFISSAEELAWISYKVSRGSTFAEKIIMLTSDIDLSGKQWIPIGGHDANLLTQENYNFQGTFNGNGYIISHLIIGSNEFHYPYDYVGLFGINAGTIKDLGLMDISLYSNGEQVGGIAGCNTGTVVNCYIRSGNVDDSGGRAGTLVGFNKFGFIENCYSLANIRVGSNQSGGLVGFQRGYIYNCYYAGNCSKWGGAVVGYNQDGTTKNCFWSTETGSATVGTGYGSDGTTNLTVNFMKSNEFVKKLNIYNDKWKDWKQDVVAINNMFPVHNTYLNPEYYWMANTEEVIEIDDVYEIYKPEQLSWIAMKANSGYDFNGKTVKLMRNLDLADKQWEPIGNNEQNAFRGVFNGNGKVITNLIIGSEIFGNLNNFVGLIGYAKNTTISNVGILDAKINCENGYTGGLVGLIYSTNVYNCFVTGKVKGNFYIGGLIGGSGTQDGIIANCYTKTDMLGTYYVGGILGGGFYQIAPVVNCYTLGSVTGNSQYQVGSIAGRAYTVSNCYWNTDAKYIVDGFDIEKDEQKGVGGFNSINSFDTAIGKTISELKQQSTFTDWDFTSTWAIDSSSTINNGLPYLLSSIPPSAPLNYTVTYNANAATGGAVPIDIESYLQGATVTVAANTGNLVKTGYSFVGWNTKLDGSGISYIENSTFVISSVNVILYAQWAINNAELKQGDINADGLIDISDVVMVAEIAVGITGYTPEQILRANVSDKMNMTVDVSDVVLIAERAVGGTELFPVDLP